MTDQPRPSKLCPLFSAGMDTGVKACLGEVCALWDEQNHCCVMLTLGRTLASRGFSGASVPAHHEGMTPLGAPQAQPERVRCSDCKFYSPPRASRWWAFCRNYGLWMPPELTRVCDDFEPAKKDEQGAR
jgi:hypothetical protein